MKSKDNSSTKKSEREVGKGPFLSSNVKDILKRKREDKQKKGIKKMNLISILPIENQDIENDINSPDKEENEDKKMIEDSEKNNNNIELEKKAKLNYKTLYSKHNNFDINFDTKIGKAKEKIKRNESKFIGICCKELFILIINVISFVLFYLSFIKRLEADNNNSIYYYFIYPITKISFVLLLVSCALDSIIIILIKIQKISMFHLFYKALLYLGTYFKYHLTNSKNSSFSNFDPANCHFFIFFILMIHTLGLIFILYNISYYFYINGQLTRRSNLTGLFFDYWETERKIKKLEQYIKINLDQLITSKTYSHEDNTISTKRNCKVIWRIIILGFIIILVHGLLLFKKIKVFNCNYLTQEFNITESDKYCKLPEPKGYCYMNALSGFFDESNNINNCKSNKYSEIEKDNLISDLKNKYSNYKISSYTKLFGYPLTNNKDYYFDEIKSSHEYNNDKNQERNMTQFEAKINKEIYDIETNTNSGQKPEIILDYSNVTNPKLKIDLQYNSKLSDERNKNDINSSLFKNVFVVYLSGVSQFYFKNVLPRLFSFISKFDNEYSDIDKQMSIKSYQFKRYHSFSNDSFSNYFFMFNDYSKNSIKELKSNLKNKNIEIYSHLKYFKDSGYITGQSIDTCDNFDHQLKHDNTFWDHENAAISCDPNYLGVTENNNHYLYGKSIYSYHTEYALQFWEKYKNNKKYFRLIFNSVNEKTGSSLSYLDQPLYDLFIKLNFNGLLNDTAIFFVSEIGGVQDYILYNFGKNNEKEINAKFGTFFLLINKQNNISKNTYKIINKNQNMLITPFDIYISLVNIAVGNKINNIKLFIDENSNKGESVFDMIDGKSRNCQFYKNYWMDEQFCMCLNDGN